MRAFGTRVLRRLMLIASLRVVSGTREQEIELKSG